MKLLYVYIKRFGTIFEDQSFSFSDSYSVKYERNNMELIIHKEEKALTGFYGKCISDITAIVGKNGVGKTTLLNIIGRGFKDRVEFLNLCEDEVLDRYFLIYHVENDIFFFEGIWDYLLKGMELDDNELFHAFYFQVKDESCIKLDKFNFQYDDSTDRILYLGNKRKNNTDLFRLVSLNDWKKTKFIERISEKDCDYGEWYKTYLNLFQKQIISSYNIMISFSINPIIQDFYNCFFYIEAVPTEEVERQIDQYVLLVNEYVEDLYKHIFSCIINYLYVKFGGETEQINYGLSEVISKIDYNTILQKVEDAYSGKYEKTDIEAILYKIKEYVLENGYNTIEKDTGWYRVRDELKSEVLKNKMDFLKIFDKISKIMRNYFQIELFEKYIQKVKLLFESLYDAREFIVPGVDEFKLIMKTDSFEKKVYDVLKSYTKLVEIIDEIKKETSKRDDYINPLIMNGMECSEGEKKIIALFSAIKSYCRKFIDIQPIRKHEKYFIVLVDEIENEMHLEWSRTLLKHLSELLDNEYFEMDLNSKYYWSELGFRIQLIFTTHSPFILSDLKKSSIIALHKDDGKGKKQDSLHTFAQNIQRIMANEFFINDCYGSLAQSKIQEIIQLITAEPEIAKEDEKNIEMILSEIGEPIVRKKLEEMFYKKIGKRKKWVEQLLWEEKH